MATRVMGFDVSSKTIGYGVLDVSDKEIKYIASGTFQPSKKGSIFDKLSFVKVKINELLQQYQPTEIAIEDIAQFIKGKSSANTIITLALFNRAVGLCCYEYLNNNSPFLYNVLKIRHGLKFTKKLPLKTDMPKLIETRLSIAFPYKYFKDKKNKTNKIKESCYDEADGIAVGLYHCLSITKAKK